MYSMSTDMIYQPYSHLGIFVYDINQHIISVLDTRRDFILANQSKTWLDSLFGTFKVELNKMRK